MVSRRIGKGEGTPFDMLLKLSLLFAALQILRHGRKENVPVHNQQLMAKTWGWDSCAY